MARILIVDDVAPMAEQYAYDLKRLGEFTTAIARTGGDALTILAAGEADCVVLDLEMPGMDGFDVLRTLRHRGDDVPVIVYTGTGNFDRCIQAMRLGADGFVDKAEPVERVVHEIESAMERTRLRREVLSLQERLGESSLIGQSESLRELRTQIGRLAAVPATVLILGESGTGKELVARDLHRLSDHATRPFIALNAAALPEQLVESELFGHERGAFTGATTARQGAFEAADGGTIFLDEIGELPLAAQAKLLRVLEQREVTRLGGSAARRLDVRVVAATNRDLETEVKEGRFRDDLLFRLNVHTLQVPPLRARVEDIPVLARHFATVVAEGYGMLPRQIAPEAMEQLMAFEWKRNNVRELRNVVERMIVAATGEVLQAKDLPASIVGSANDSSDDACGSSFQALRRQAERRIVLAALERNEWQITRTAAELELADHASLIKLMKRLGLRS